MPTPTPGIHEAPFLVGLWGPWLGALGFATHSRVLHALGWVISVLAVLLAVSHPDDGVAEPVVIASLFGAIGILSTAFLWPGKGRYVPIATLAILGLWASVVVVLLKAPRRTFGSDDEDWQRLWLLASGAILVVSSSLALASGANSQAMQTATIVVWVFGWLYVLAGACLDKSFE